ncbi:MAG: 6-carboxytetrahydropterin synthase [Saccharospirillaceae bacterium]|nr:6-carboxytetrahydropterin synthase [Pseudomonadales bacterium]NRB80006.1 6-carboxytetrahydropterin synthase [Saccharospirillaceae bacterium]
MSTLFVDQLTVIDFCYFDRHRGVIGESWIVDVKLYGELNDEGMVFDFGHVKKQIKQAIDSGIDHKLVVPTGAPGLSIIEKDETIFIEHHNNDQLTLKYQSPREAVYLIDAEDIQINTVERMLEEYLNTLMPSNVKRVEIKLRCEDIPTDFYHYAHGLKKHLGDCQRIAHGHRSKIEVNINHKRHVVAEKLVSTWFHDIYIGTSEDIKNEFEQNGQAFYEFAYEAEQGYFSISLNKNRCHIMFTDSTVELIAQHLCDLLDEHYPNDDILVKAFEGVQKGAIAQIIR